MKKRTTTLVGKRYAFPTNKEIDSFMKNENPYIYLVGESMDSLKIKTVGDENHLLTFEVLIDCLPQTDHKEAVVNFFGVSETRAQVI